MKFIEFIVEKDVKQQFRQFVNSDSFNKIDDKVLSKALAQISYNVRDDETKKSYKEILFEFLETEKNFPKYAIKQLWDILISNDNFSNISKINKFFSVFGLNYNNGTFDISNIEKNWAQNLHNKTLSKICKRNSLYTEVLSEIMKITCVTSGNVSGKGELGVAIITNGWIGNNTVSNSADVYYSDGKGDNSTEVKYLSNNEIALVPSRYSIIKNIDKFLDQYNATNLDSIVKDKDNRDKLINFFKNNKVPEVSSKVFNNCKSEKDFIQTYLTEQIKYYLDKKNSSNLLIYNEKNKNFFVISKSDEKIDNSIIELVSKFKISLPRKDSRHRAINIKN